MIPRKPYPSDLSASQWQHIAPLIPPAKPGGRPRTVDVRECLNAIFYVTRAGGDWRMLPHDLPAWNTAYAYFRRWQEDGTWERIHDTLREQVRVAAGREATPSAAIIASQSVQTTAKGGIKPWLKRQWCIPTVGAEFVWRMEDVLDLYAEGYDPAHPVVCFDALPYQLVAETRLPVPAAPGRTVRDDYEYRRMGTCNLFACFAPQAGRRHVAVTQRRTSDDFAEAMRWLVDDLYPEARWVRVVRDNLNTHTGAALYQRFPPAEARRILRKREWHYTPKHGSWLNQVEIEWSVLTGQCLDRRIGDMATVQREVAAWQESRNRAKTTVAWRFGVNEARQKLARLYPS